jgi:ribosomal protein S12 methylthiotransferase accessory factor
MAVKPVGLHLWVGPIFRPGMTGYWECLAEALRAHRRTEQYVESKRGRNGHVPTPRGFNAATQPVAWSVAATEAAEWIARGSNPDLEGKLLTLDTLRWETRYHALTRLPHCPACGTPVGPQGRDAVPFVVEGRRKTFTHDGGHRAASPEQTLARFEHLVSPILGAVSRLVRSSGENAAWMNVYVSGSNHALRRGEDYESLRKGLRAESSGKGVTDVQARAGALCEAIERRSGVFRGDEPRRPARLHVPVRLGWLARPLDEDQLNSVPMFL